MAVTPSTMLPLGTKAPNFRLPDPEGKLVSLDDFKKTRPLSSSRSSATTALLCSTSV